MARVLIIRHHSEDRPGLVGEAFEARGFELDVVMMDAESPTPSAAGYDLLVVLGSKHAVYDERIEAAAGRASNLIGAIACGSRVAAHKASACSAAAMISSGPTPSPNSAPKRINAGAPPAANAPPARTTRPARVASAEPRAAMWR